MFPGTAEQIGSYGAAGIVRLAQLTNANPASGRPFAGDVLG